MAVVCNYSYSAFLMYAQQRHSKLQCSLLFEIQKCFFFVLSFTK